jgi:hypothetical protein
MPTVLCDPAAIDQNTAGGAFSNLDCFESCCVSILDDSGHPEPVKAVEQYQKAHGDDPSTGTHNLQNEVDLLGQNGVTSTLFALNGANLRAALDKRHRCIVAIYSDCISGQANPLGRSGKLNVDCCGHGIVVYGFDGVHYWAMNPSGGRLVQYAAANLEASLQPTSGIEVTTVLQPDQWTRWFGLGGQIVGRPSVVMPGADTQDIYVRGMDNGLKQKWWNGKWGPSDSGWLAHNDGFQLGAAPTVVSFGPNHRDVFAPDLEGVVHHKAWNGSAWTGWASLGGIVQGSVGAAVYGPGQIDLYARGLDNALYQRWNDGSGWNSSGWQRHNDGFLLGGAPVVVATLAGFRDVFARGQDGSPWHKYWDGSKWNGWFNLGGLLQEQPGVTIPAVPNEDLYIQGEDNALWQKWWDGAAFHPSANGWIRHNDHVALGAPPAVVAWGNGFRDIFARAADGSVIHKKYPA